MATFGLSALMHWVAIEALGKGPEYGPTWPLARFFLMQGVGVLLEGAFRAVTGRRTKGLLGRIWVWSWIFLWAPSAMEVVSSLVPLGLCERKVDTASLSSQYARRGQTESMALGSLSAGRPVRWFVLRLSDVFSWGLH